jgi:hypothetical protein
MKSNSRSTSLRFATVLLFSLLAMASVAVAQLPVPASSQFDITGFIQSATLGGPGAGPGVGAHMGGMITVNGHAIIVPSETIVILPAAALTWQELFALAPAPYTGAATGMALSDVPAPMTTYEAQVIGNRVLGGPGGADVYIAGLIYISQHALNTGSGFINCINYATGEMLVGGPIGNCATGARVQINDPIITTVGDVAVGTGRYSRGQSPDPRFQVDQDNPTIASATGFPMCMPRVVADPNIAGNPDDGLCPITQRPLVGYPSCLNPATAGARCTSFTTLPPGGGSPDPSIQAPFEVGDWITFAGTLVQDCAMTGCPGGGPTAGPWPAAGVGATYISAHTISNNTAIYTFPGTNPAYVSTEVTIIGTGGLTVLGAGEAVIRTRFEGMTSDVDPTAVAQRTIHLYGIDFDPTTGNTSDRDFGTISVDPGPENGLGAVKGRWRFRPPCLPFGSIPTKPVKDCVMNASGTFLPPPREMRAVIQGAFTAPITAASPRAANGIVYGQYHAPILEYIFPENVPGAPIVENNFNNIDFLAQGGYASGPGTLVGQLNPWPSNVAPPPPCTVTANAGGPYTVPSGGTVTLAGSATTTGSGTVTFSWAPPPVGTLSNLNIANPVYTAPAVLAPTPVPLSLTATCNTSSSTSGGTVTINPPGAPTVNAVNPITVVSGTGGSFVATGSDPNVPALTPLTFNVVQTSGPALIGITVTPLTATSATVSFTAPVVAAITPATLSLTATNTAPLTSAAVTVNITINPPPVGDTVLITSAEYRTGKQRLIINATSNAPGPVTLKLQPYLTTTGVVYNPAPSAGGLGDTFVLTAGVYILDITGAPAPACGNAAGYQTPCPSKPMDVLSSGGGDSLPFALTRIRQ